MSRDESPTEPAHDITPGEPSEIRLTVRLRVLPVECEVAPATRDVAPATRDVAASPRGPFVPTAYQRALLRVLAGTALRTDALAGASGGDRRRLFRPGGLTELRARGLVGHHDRLGYYRPDDPPPELLPE